MAGEQTPVNSTDERGEGAPSRCVTYSHRPVTPILCHKYNKGCVLIQIMGKTIKVSNHAHSKLAEYRDAREHTSFDSALREMLREVENE